MMNFDVPISPERLQAVKRLLQEELTDRQRTMLLAAVLALTLPDKQIALVVSGVKALGEVFHRAAQKLNISK